MGEKSDLSDRNKTPTFGVRVDVLNGNVGKVEVLQESGKEQRVNTANFEGMDNTCSRQADGGSEFLSEKAREQERNVKGSPKINKTILKIQHGQSEMSAESREIYEFLMFC